KAPDRTERPGAAGRGQQAVHVDEGGAGAGAAELQRPLEAAVAERVGRQGEREVAEVHGGLGQVLGRPLDILAGIGDRGAGGKGEHEEGGGEEEGGRGAADHGFLWELPGATSATRSDWAEGTKV